MDLKLKNLTSQFLKVRFGTSMKIFSQVTEFGSQNAEIIQKNIKFYVLYQI